MTCNVGGFDRILRILVGLTVIVLGIRFKKWWGAFGAIPLLTGFAGFCPAYVFNGKSTGNGGPLFSWSLCNRSKGDK